MAAAPQIAEYEADVAEGLEGYALAELRGLRHMHGLRLVEPGIVRFGFSGKLSSLLRLRTVAAVYRVASFAVPRPKALLGHEHFSLIASIISGTFAAYQPGSFQTFHLSAAGSESAVLSRLKSDLATRFNLRESDDADLLLRLRRAEVGEGWEMLTRLSPRPLQTRGWRVCNLEGALNSTIASVMNSLTQPDADQVYLNLASGSGTLLIERLALADAKLAMACDINPATLPCIRRNLEAAGYVDNVTVGQWDARQLPLQAASVDVLTADLPFGQLVGSHEHNEELYPAVIAEAARVAKPGAHFVLISHEIRLMERVLEQEAGWRLDELIRVNQGGLNPRIYHLLRV